ncbi:hypothetical protein [Streptomyces violaceusniger]|uniref:hypothetical protein n=1 Tax=Streptomyces violaceusniger TaxID=68280 RepID=UPI0002E72A19|nr:hypothetical protein [Streptomyces violaceusniger]
MTVTLDDDIITDVEVTPNATIPTSLDYQERFTEAIAEIVVGTEHRRGAGLPRGGFQRYP